MPRDGINPQYEQRTEDVIVRVAPEFLAEQSNPRDSRFIWAYTVEIDNQSGQDLTVTDRFWQIADSSGQVQEVRAAGVVGETPMVKSGETFRYTSGAPLTARVLTLPCRHSYSIAHMRGIVLTKALLCPLYKS
jgi:ApaG protein